MTETELIVKAYNTACEKGWHDEDHHDAHWLMLIITEIAEAVQADRKNRHANRDEYINLMNYALREKMLSGDILEQYKQEAFSTQIKDSFEDELADICIRCYDFAGLKGVNLDMYAEGVSWNMKVANLRNASVPVFMHYLTSRFAAEPHPDWTLIKEALYVLGEYAAYHDIDLLWYIKEKMKFNDNRPYKHGCQY